MDRDIAILIKDKMAALNTSLTVIATSTVPSSPDAKNLLKADLEAEEEIEEPEPVPEPTTRKKSTSK